ncbi:MAG: hypothetical protein P1P58_07800, partial [Treponema sp.]
LSLYPPSPRPAPAHRRRPPARPPPAPPPPPPPPTPTPPPRPRPAPPPNYDKKTLCRFLGSLKTLKKEHHYDKAQNLVYRNTCCPYRRYILIFIM